MRTVQLPSFLPVSFRARIFAAFYFLSIWQNVGPTAGHRRVSGGGLIVGHRFATRSLSRTVIGLLITTLCTDTRGVFLAQHKRALTRKIVEGR